MSIELCSSCLKVKNNVGGTMERLLADVSLFASQPGMAGSVVSRLRSILNTLEMNGGCPSCINLLKRALNP